MKYIQIKQCSECQKGISIDRNEEMLAGNVDADASYPDANPDAT